MRAQEKARPGRGAGFKSGGRPDPQEVTSRLAPLEAAELNTYAPHAEMFGHAVAVLANSRVTFTIDDVLSVLGHPVLGSVGAHGALMTKAAATGRIEPVGFTHSQRTGGVIRVWRGAGRA